MNTIKKTLAVLLALAMVLSMTVIPASAATSFTDVNQGDWYYDSVMRWANAGIISGYQDGTFQPLNNVKRCEFAKIMAAVLGLTEQSENIFADVPDDAWYAPYVLACVKAGIINGYEENGQKYFKADNYITRQEAIKMYVVALQLTGGEDTALDTFPDSADVGTWAEAYIKTILSYGAVEGKSDGGLDPQGNIRRAEVAIILDRLVGVYVSQSGEVSTTTEAESDKTGNLVIVHAACPETVTVEAEGEQVLVTVGTQEAAITPTNSKTPAILVADSVAELEEGESAQVSDSVIEEPTQPAETAPTQPAETAPTQPGETTPTQPAESVTIDLWTYPVGLWGDSSQAGLNELLSKFHAAYPNITVNVTCLNYADGDAMVDTAIAVGDAPDLILEGPERLAAAWAEYMLDLSDIRPEGVYENVAAACVSAEGKTCMHPLSMTVHCMAINKTVFEEANALQYIDLDTRSWTTENFFKAVQAVYDAGYENVGTVYCGSQGGDQGTRALVTNLYSGTYTNADHTAYTFESEANVRALEALAAQDGITFDATLAGGDEISLFRNGQLQMSFCWNYTQLAMGETTADGDEILFLNFPSDDGKAQLQGGIWGFGAFDNGDSAKAEAAKTFIRWACEENAKESVGLSCYFPVKESLGDMFAEGYPIDYYNRMMVNFGDYYQVTPNWSRARNAWVNMLQAIANGTAPGTAAENWGTVANGGTPSDPTPEEAVSITLWTYPIGTWTSEESVTALIEKYQQYNPNVTVNVEFLDYSTGDDKVNTAIAAGAAPDLIMEGPERLAGMWSAYMLDLSELRTDGIYENVAAACMDADGNYVMQPLAMMNHCMAINKTVFEEANALQYIDLDTYTWTTENFFKAVQAVYDAGYENVGAIYCAGQGGDQGTRALVTNLYGGTYTNADHNGYTFDSEANVRALEALAAQDGIRFDSSLVGGDEIALFRNGQLQMSFCWNYNQQCQGDVTSEGDEILFVSFPSDDGIPELQSGIWGFGAFDNGDEVKAEAAKDFIRWATQINYADTVEMTGFFPVCAFEESIYAENTLPYEFNKLMPYCGDYYQVASNWSQARTAWWNMLSEIAAGGDISSIAAKWTVTANTPAA